LEPPVEGKEEEPECGEHEQRHHQAREVRDHFSEHETHEGGDQRDQDAIGDHPTRFARALR
jgi:hypothetical protein